MNGRPASRIEHARWLLDGGPVSQELDGFCIAPAAGEHVVQLTATADGLEGQASHRFLTHELEAEREPTDH